MRLRSWVLVSLDEATPTTGVFRTPRWAMPYSAGKIFLWARSPVIPNKTSASARWVLFVAKLISVGLPLVSRAPAPLASRHSDVLHARQTGSAWQRASSL